MNQYSISRRQLILSLRPLVPPVLPLSIYVRVARPDAICTRPSKNCASRRKPFLPLAVNDQ